MNLIADIGNTSTKLALFEGRKKISVIRTEDADCRELEELLSLNRIERAIISSVRKLPQFVPDLLFKNIRTVHVLSYMSKLPFRIEYESPETLGSDRIAAVAGAYELYGGKETLVIDAGTAITYDFMSGAGYKGGNISPGISMRFRALNSFTDQLPLVKIPEKYSFPGRNTNDAIAAGVISGVIYEINEYIRTFEKKHSDIKVILTGGDGGYLKEKIKYQVDYMPDIVIDGLNYILEYNAK
jgi:type III pantothenate kinase